MKSPRAAAPATKGIRIRWPRWYDALNRFHFLGREDQFRERTVDLAGVTGGQVVLDVGCGTGNLSMAARARAGADGHVYGLDAAPEMIGEAERKAAARQLDIRYQVALIEDIPYPDRSFDVVLSSLMLHHLPKGLKRRGVAEISRVLKPGGRLFAVDIDPPLMGNLRTVAQAMELNGFIDIQRGPTKFRTLWIPIHYLTGTKAAF